MVVDGIQGVCIMLDHGIYALKKWGHEEGVRTGKGATVEYLWEILPLQYDGASPFQEKTKQNKKQEGYSWQASS